MNNFIEIYKNALSQELCESMIEEFEKAQKKGMTRTRKESDGPDVPKTRKDDTAFLGLAANNFKIYVEFINILWEQVYKRYIEKYEAADFATVHSFSVKIQKTEPGQGYHVWHSEVGHRQDCNRILAWAGYLNDNFEAGETEFLYQQYRYKPVKGDMIVFPAAFTHIHRGNPPIGGTKYIVTGWIEL